ncbi:MAG TPA: glycosyltransferase [Candidatus Saccharimonadales bacterium]|nr:glycosyltransferase [Candidatus Saccharimonadales bacterium]
MKVLCVTNLYPTPERPAWGAFVRSQMESLRPLGVDFDLLLVRGWESRWNYWWQRREVRAALRRGYELVHVHFGLTGAVLEGVPTPALVLSLCGDDLLGRSRPDGSIAASSRPMMWLSRRLARRADAVIVKSEHMRQALLPLREAVVVPNGVDFEVFVPAPQAEARRRLGWNEAERCVLFAADPAVAAKNYPLAEAALRCLLAGGVDARLMPFHGRPQRELVDAMNAADALLLTSWAEGSPNVVKEAMVVGLPVVSVDVGDVREHLQGCAGCAVTERAAGPLAAALRPLLERPRRTDGRSRMEHLRSERVAERLLGVYRQALDSRRAGRAGDRGA